jgi:hypothetical protein
MRRLGRRWLRGIGPLKTRGELLRLRLEVYCFERADRPRRVAQFHFHSDDEIAQTNSVAVR